MKLNVLAIKKLLAEKRMTITALAQAAGISKSLMCLILRRGSCSIKNCGLIADALNVEIEEIWKGD